eukprot:568419-Prorocentrum_minimum.AAC.3
MGFSTKKAVVDSINSIDGYVKRQITYEERVATVQKRVAREAFDSFSKAKEYQTSLLNARTIQENQVEQIRQKLVGYFVIPLCTDAKEERLQERMRELKRIKDERDEELRKKHQVKGLHIQSTSDPTWNSTEVYGFVQSITEALFVPPGFCAAGKVQIGGGTLEKRGPIARCSSRTISRGLREHGATCAS